MFNSSVNCTFPLFPDVAPLPLSKFNDTFDVTVFVIGGGSGGGANGLGGGEAGGVTVQTAQISMGQSVSIVVGLGGTPAAHLSDPSSITAAQGQGSALIFSGTSVIAQGGGFGGTRRWNLFTVLEETVGLGEVGAVVAVFLDLNADLPVQPADLAKVFKAIPAGKVTKAIKTEK